MRWYSSSAFTLILSLDENYFSEGSMCNMYLLLHIRMPHTIVAVGSEYYNTRMCGDPFKWSRIPFNHRTWQSHRPCESSNRTMMTSSYDTDRNRVNIVILLFILSLPNGMSTIRSSSYHCRYCCVWTVEYGAVAKSDCIPNACWVYQQGSWSHQ